MQINNKLVEKVLYSNTDGTNGVVTLNDSVENFKCIEIFFKNANSEGGSSAKIYNPNGKGVDMGLFVTVSSSQTTFFITCRAVINGITITPTLYGNSSFTATTQTVNTVNNSIYIYRVVGYR